jgi:hypothetical protein
MSNDPTRQQLQQAYELIRSGRKAEAEALLLPILKANEDDANAWWLMANAVSSPDDIREALQNVLRLRPGDAKAQQMLDSLNARTPADEFPMAGGSSTPAWTAGSSANPVQVVPPVVVQKSGGTNPLVIILAVVGIIALVGCIACFLLPTLGITIFGQQILNEVMTAAPEFQEIMGTITALPPGAFLGTGDLVQRGTIEYGQTVTQTVDTFDDDGWTFTGSAGDRVTIEVNARDNDLDPEVYLLDSSNSQLGYNDDSGSNSRNSRLAVTLPANGTYTIRVSAFGMGGGYELILRRG